MDKTKQELAVQLRVKLYELNGILAEATKAGLKYRITGTRSSSLQEHDEIEIELYEEIKY